MDRAPLDLLTLRSATTAYMEILRTNSGALEGLAAVGDAQRSTLAARLLGSIEATLDQNAESGTVANVAYLLGELLGESSPPALLPDSATATMSP